MRRALCSSGRGNVPRAGRNWEEWPQQQQKNNDVLELLESRFVLYGLCREHIARLVALIVPASYNCAMSDFVGERAAMGVQRLQRPGVAPEDLRSPRYKRHLRELARIVRQQLPAYACHVLPRAAWTYLQTTMLPGVADFEHLQLHEHNLCEFGLPRGLS